MPVYLVPVAFTHYASRSDLEREFGTENIRTWADKDNDNDQTKISANIDYALTLAERYINARAYELRANVPDSSSPLYYMLADFQITYSGVLLYMGRGQLAAGTMGSEGAGIYNDAMESAKKQLTGMLISSRDRVGMTGTNVSAPQAIASGSNVALVDRLPVQPFAWGWGYAGWPYRW
jgi:hypothetical protein